jgi:hypothetical protein
LASSCFSVASSSSPRLRALLGEQRIAADHEALARIVGRTDLYEIALVEQRQLEAARLDEAADRRRPRGGGPVKVRRFDGLFKAPAPRARSLL